jgi:hypothetical protein
MKKISIIVLMFCLMIVPVSAMIYSNEYSRFVNDADKTTCNPMNGGTCNTYRDFLDVNYFDDARYFDDSGTKTNFLSKAGSTRYNVYVYFKYFDDAFYVGKITNLTTTCVVWHNVFEVDGDINSTIEFQYSFSFGTGNNETLQKFKLRGGETLQCMTDALYANNAARRLTMPVRIDVVEPAYMLQDEAQCNKDISNTQSDIDKCNGEIDADTSQVNPSVMLYAKRLIYYFDYGVSIVFILVRIAIIIGVIYLLFKIGFLLYEIIKRESQ